MGVRFSPEAPFMKSIAKQINDELRDKIMKMLDEEDRRAVQLLKEREALENKYNLPIDV